MMFVIIQEGAGEYGCIAQPLLNVALDHVPDELHLLLRVTDVLLTNLLDDAMERDEIEDHLKKRGMEKGVHLKAVVNIINNCGITFNVWEKQDSPVGKVVMNWTSLMGDEKKKLLDVLPNKLAESINGIHDDTKDTVVQLWEVNFIQFVHGLYCSVDLLKIF